MKKTRSGLLAVVGAGSLLLAACGGGNTGDEESGDEKAAPTITHVYEQEFSSYNGNTASDNAAKNNIVLNRVLTGFWYFNEKGEVEPNKDFGSYEKTSDDPLTVEHTINEDAVWSDETPIDCDDVLLMWAALGGKYGFSSAGTDGIEDVKVPDCEAGDKEFTFEYSKPFADWEAQTPGQFLPAHVIAEQAGLSEEEFITAIKEGDADALKKGVDFYNTGWVMANKKLLPEKQIPSSGPYKLTEWQSGQSITLEANDNYWGEAPKTERIVIRFIPQEEQAQALENREIQLAEPQPTPDLVNQFDQLSGVNVEVGDAYFYDHLDFNFESSKFSDPQLREAFARCVPIEKINTDLIKPMKKDAEPLTVRNVMPFQQNYENVTGDWGAKYLEADVQGAKQLLSDSGEDGMTVRLGYQTPNERRQQAAELVKESCDKAGFDVKIQGAADFFDSGGALAENQYDVALFGWTGSSLVSGWASTYQTPDKCTAEAKGNNNGCYSSKKVDSLIQKLNVEPDLDQQDVLIKQIEAELWKDLATIPLYMNPSLTAWDQTIQNVAPNMSQASVTWNMDQWQLER